MCGLGGTGAGGKGDVQRQWRGDGTGHCQRRYEASAAACGGHGPREGPSPATPVRRPVCTRVTAVRERRNETPCFVFDKTKSKFTDAEVRHHHISKFKRPGTKT